MILIAIGQFLMGASALVAISRQLWAFARDDGLPFANYIKIVHPKLSTPINAICFSAIVAMCIGCISLIGSTAANALFSLSVLGNYISWMTPQLLRFIGSVSFVPGKFYLGPVWSPLVNLISILSQVFIIVMCCFPDYKHVTKETMNYTIAVNGLTWVTSMMYYYVYKRHSFSGPKTNLEEEEVIEVVEILEGVDITPNLGPAPPLKIYDR
jgi:amino acid transporter